MKSKYATAINCIDGRVQIPVIEYMRKKFNVKYIDMVTEGGPDKILAQNKDECIIQSIKNRVEISIKYHDSKLLAIAGHYDCAANPVDKEQHIIDIKKSIKLLESWNLPVKIIGLFVDKKCKVHEIK